MGDKPQCYDLLTRLPKQYMDIYRQCIDTALDDSERIIRAVTQQVAEIFEGRAQSDTRGAAHKRAIEMLALVREREAEVINTFVSEFGELLRQRVRSAPEDKSRRRAKPKAGPRGADAYVQEDNEVSQFVLMVESGAEWEIREFDNRMDALLNRGLTPNDGERRSSPLRSEIYGRALQRALAMLDVAGEARASLVRAFGVALTSAIKQTFDDYSARLEMGSFRISRPSADASSASVQTVPGLSLELDLNGGDIGAHVSVGEMADGDEQPVYLEEFDLSSSKPVVLPASRNEPTEPDSPQGEDEARADTDDLKPRLSALVDRLIEESRAQSASDAAGTQGTAQARQGNVIKEHRQALHDACEQPLQKLIIDAVLLMFDNILTDERLLIPVRTALGRLQMPVVRLALSDPGVASSPNHPARRFINRIASYGATYPSADEAQAAGFLDWVDRHTASIHEATDETGELYARQLEELESWIVQRHAPAPEQAENGEEARKFAESRSELGRKIQERVTALLGSAEADGYLKDFLLGPWTAVLVESTLRYGEEAPPTRAYGQGAKDLLLSVQPKLADEQREEMLERLPTLVQRLEEGLALIDWSPADRAAFFSYLLRAHAHAMRGEPGAPAASGTDAAPAPEQASASQQDVEPLARRQADAPQDEAPAASAQPAVPDAPEPDVSDAVQAGPDTAVPDPQAFIDSLLEGHWVQWKLEGQWTRAQLTWRSPEGKFFMFNSCLGGQSHSLTRRAFERQVQSGDIIADEEAPANSEAIKKKTASNAPEPA